MHNNTFNRFGPNAAPNGATPGAMLLNVHPPDAPRVRTLMRSRSAQDTVRNPILRRQSVCASPSSPVPPSASAAEPRPPPTPSTPPTKLVGPSASGSQRSASAVPGSSTTVLLQIRQMLDELRQSRTTAMIDDADDPSSPFYAIQSIASGRNSDGFWHAVQPTDDPYHLRLVSERPQASTSYCTFTARGLSHVRGDVVEFTPLEQWIREYMLHRRLLGFRFFQVFPQWRCSYRWRAAVKRSLVSYASARLSDGLLQLHAVARPRLLEIRKMLLTTLINRPQKQLLLVPLEDLVPLDLDAFAARQQTHAQQQLQTIAKCCEDIRSVVEVTCKAFHSIALDDIGGGDFSEIIHERTASKRHVGLTRVCRYMTRDALVQLATASSKCLADLMEHSRSELFCATIQIDCENRGVLSFSPSRSTVEATMQGILSSMLAVVEDPSVVSAMTMLAVWEEDADAGGTIGGTASILAESVAQQVNVQRVVRSIGSICDACEQFTTSLGSWTLVFQECMELTAPVVRSKNPPPAWFQSTLSRLRGYLVALDDMAPKKRVASIFSTDTSQIATALRPRIHQCVRNITRLLPRMTQEKANVLLVQISKTITCLKKMPQALADVAPYLNFCREVNMEVYDEAFGLVSSMFGVLESDPDIDITSMADLLELRDTLLDNMMTLGNVASDITDVREKLVAHFSAVVAQELNAVHSSAEVLLEEVRGPRLSNRPPLEDGGDNEATLCEYAHKLLTSAEALLRSEHRLVEYQSEFGVEMTPVESVRTTRNAAWLVHQLWAGSSQWRDAEAALLKAKWVDWSASEFTAAVTAANAVLVTCSVVGTPAVDALRRRVEFIQSHRFVVDVLLNKHLQPHHWRRIDDIVRKQSKRGISSCPDRTLQDLSDSNIEAARSELLAVSLAASQEVELERQLLAVQLPWVGGARQPAVELQLMPFKEHRDMWVVGGTDVDAIHMLLDASRTALTVILQNRFCEGALRARAEKQLNTLIVIAETVEKWLAFQKLWMVLEAVFGVPEIARQWPQDETSFAQADRFYRDLMKSFGGGGCKLHQALGNGVVCTSFDGPMQRLETVAASMERQLDNKRASFPRLYFLSNAGMLDLLGMSRFPERTHVHIGKLFEFVAGVRVSGTSPGEVNGVLGLQGEVLDVKALRARGDVERWLGLLEKAISDAVREKCFAALAASASPHATAGTQRRGGLEWIRRFPLQALLIASHVAWSGAVQQSSTPADTKKKAPASAAAASKGGAPLQRCLHNLQEDIDSLMDVAVRKDLHKIDRLTLAALVTQSVGLLQATKRIMASLSPASITDGAASSLEMLLSLTATANPVDRSIQFHVLGHNVAYAYEYIGVVPRLVMTEVTRSAFASFVLALRLDKGCAAVGPPGTGKSETVKEFSRTVARHNFVFNCSATTDVAMLLRVICGLAQQGSFVALDEFHCVSVEVLSVVAMHLGQLQCAQSMGAQSVVLSGMHTPLRLAPRGSGTVVGGSGGILVTMNNPRALSTGALLDPLPENLKVLFRPITIMAPNTVEIVEVVLYSEGFRFSSVLAPKIVLLFDLCAERTSGALPHQHNHAAEGILGLRAIKPILLHAASLRTAQLEKISSTVAEEMAACKIGIDDEIVCIAQAIVSALAPRLTTSENALLRCLIEEVFGAASTRFAPDADAAFERACRICAPGLGLDIAAEQLLRMHQLHNTLVNRFGVAVVGHAGAGKSVVQSVTRHALGQSVRGGNGDLWRRTMEFRMNPGSMTYHELLGSVHPTTNQWTEGCLPWVVRQISERGMTEGAACAHWLVFDGPPDARWMESLNSSLDDSRVFCFDNGQRWPLANTTRILFECETLAHAAPSTVSRLGVVALDDRSVEEALARPIEALLQRPVTKSVNEGQHVPGATMATSTARDVLSIFASFLQFAQRGSLLSMPGLTDVHLAQVFLRVLQGTMLSSEDNARNPLHCVGFALVWSIGCAFHGTEREAFDVYFRSRFDDTGASVPPSGLVFDYCLVGGDWVPWPPVHTPLSLRGNVSMGAVPTDDMQRIDWLRTTTGGNFLITGPVGSGKSTALRMFSVQVDGCSTAAPAPATAYVAMTRSLRPQRIASSLETAVADRGAALLQLCSPSPSRAANGMAEPALSVLASNPSVLLLVDDVHFAPTEGGNGGAPTCPTIEYLRQILTNGEVWDAHRRALQPAANAALHMTTASSSSGPSINGRVLRHLHVYALTEMIAVAAQIFQRDIAAVFADAPSATLRSLGEKLVTATLDVFTNCAKGFSSGAGRRRVPHVLRVFSLAQLSALFRGLREAFSMEVVQNTSVLASLWISECHRTFRDRLTSPEEASILDAILAEVGTRNNMYVPQPPSSASDVDAMPGSLWCSFLHRDKLYEPLQNLDAVKQSVGSCAPPGALMTPYLLQHVCRMARVLSQHGAHGLLLGPMGHGKRFTAAVACARLGHQLLVAEFPSAATLKDMVHKVCRDAVARRSHSALLIPNVHLYCHDALEVVQQLLTDDDWSVCFPSEDALDALVVEAEATLEVDQRHERQAVLRTLWKIVQSRVTLLVTMSSGDTSALTEVLTAFPALTHRCVTDYYAPLPPSTLEAFAARGLGRLAASESDVHVATTLQLHEFMVGHAGRPRTPVPPTVAFVDYVHLVLRLYNREDERLMTKLIRLEAGCERMRVVQEQVVRLDHDVRNLEGTLTERADVASQLMEEVNDHATRAAVHKDAVKNRQSIAQEEARLAMMSHREAQDELLAAAPAYEAALDGIRRLNKLEIDEMRTYSVPPKGATITMKAVLMVLGEHRASAEDWGTARAVLNNGRGLVERLLNFDVGTLTGGTVAFLAELVRDPEFAPQRVGASGSQACRSLCAWVHAVYALHGVHQIVAPKQARFLIAEEDAAAAKALLNESKEQLLEAQASMVSLHSSMDAMEQDKEAVEKQLTKCRVQLKHAAILNECLHSEFALWSTALLQVRQARSGLSAFVHVAAATMAYTGALSADDRNALVADWRDLPLLRPLHPSETNSSGDAQTAASAAPTALADLRRLVPDAVVVDWHLGGLPWDSNSLTNAAIAWLGIHESKRWPLLLDPEGHGLKWLRTLGEFQYATIVSSRDEKLLTVLKRNLGSGTPTIVTDVDPRYMFHSSSVGSQLAVHDLLHRNVQHDATHGGLVVRVGEEVVAYGSGFSLAMVCRASSCTELSSEVLCSSRVINFCPTPYGIEEQILAEVVGTCMQHVEEQRIRSLKATSQLEQQLEAARVRVLETLNRASLASLLDDAALMQQLQEAHSAATALASTLAAAKEHHDQLQEKREHLRPVAQAIAAAYAALTSVQRVRAQYHVPLDQVKRIALDCLSQLTAEEITEDVPGCVRAVLSAIYERACLMCSDDDRPMVDALFFIGVLAERGDMTPPELGLWRSGDVFAATSASPEGELAAPSSRPPTLTAAQLQILVSLEAAWGVPLRATIVPMLAAVLASPTARAEDGMPSLDARGTRQAALLRLLRPDLTAQAVSMLAEAVLGPMMPNSARVEAAREALLSTMDPSTPLLLLVSPGNDPTIWLEAVAARHGMSVTVHSIGRGWDDAILDALHRTTEHGGWMLLHNCHLSPDMIETVTKKLGEAEGLTNGRSSHRADVRVVFTCPWDAPLSTTSTAHFVPPSRSITSQGAIPTAVSPSIEASAIKDRLRLLHDAILERRRYGQRGWCMPPREVSDVERIAACRIVDAVFAESSARRAGGDSQPETPVLSPLELVTIQQNIAVVYEGPMLMAGDKRVLRALLRVAFDLSDEAVAAAVGRSSLPPALLMDVSAELDSSSSTSMDVIQALAASMAPLNLQLDNSALEDRLAELVLPKGILMDEASHPTMGALRAQQEPFAVCLWSEANRTNALLEAVSADMRDAMQAVTGASAATPGGSNAAWAIATGTVPPAWLLMCPGAAAPMRHNSRKKDLKAFLKSITDGVAFLGEWIRGTRHPACYPAPLLHTPRRLLDAQLRRAGALLGVPLDKLCLHLTTDKQPHLTGLSAAPSIVLTGLVTKGFLWDGEHQQMARSTGGSMPPHVASTIPAVYVHVVVRDVDDVGVTTTFSTCENGETFACPLFQRQHDDGDTLIGMVHLPCGEERTVDQWMLANAALHTHQWD